MGTNGDEILAQLEKFRIDMNNVLQRHLLGLEEILRASQTVLQRCEAQTHDLTEIKDRLADLESIALRSLDPGCHIVTDHPLALYSDDHKHPRGVRNDDTRHPRFVRQIERIFRRPVSHLDLGCAGGGLVLDFLLGGHRSVGVEGSDYALVNCRAEWRVLPRHLFTGNIVEPFHFAGMGGELVKFDVITAWEVLEHLPETKIDSLLDNVRRNLNDRGLFVASIAMFEDRDPQTGAVWHLTVKNRSWWEGRFDAAGFDLVEGMFAVNDYPRGSGNPRAVWDWDAGRSPESGFHVAARPRKI